ncbi:hypothetical protein DVH05_024432 [Phytophthora capsici]|nr:hypothetical protein DVH05_024432 [Phytophthora capsici]
MACVYLTPSSVQLSLQIVQTSLPRKRSTSTSGASSRSTVVISARVVAWSVVRNFIIRLRDEGRDIAYDAFVKNNYIIPGRRGAHALRDIVMKDRIYIVKPRTIVILSCAQF